MGKQYQHTKQKYLSFEALSERDISLLLRAYSIVSDGNDVILKCKKNHELAVYQIQQSKITVR